MSAISCLLLLCSEALYLPQRGLAVVSPAWRYRLRKQRLLALESKCETGTRTFSIFFRVLVNRTNKQVLKSTTYSSGSSLRSTAASCVDKVSSVHVTCVHQSCCFSPVFTMCPLSLLSKRRGGWLQVVSFCESYNRVTNITSTFRWHADALTLAPLWPFYPFSPDKITWLCGHGNGRLIFQKSAVEMSEDFWKNSHFGFVVRAD